jgi:hypothetical protein
MRYRRLDADHDMVFGNQQADYLRDVPDAVAQAVLTRLMLWKGEWFLDLEEGTPYKTRVLGKYTSNTRDPILRARILQTQGVKGIAAYASQFSGDTRSFQAQATIDTVFGQTTVATPR